MTRAATFFAAIRALILGTSGNRMTNWNQGGVHTSLAEATADQLEAESFRADTMYRNLYWQTASGTDLDLRAAEMGLTRKPAQKATGYVRFTGNGLGTGTIPAGTKVATADPRLASDAVEFVSGTEVEVPGEGDYVDVLSEAVVAGLSGNVAADEIDVMVDAVGGVTVSNASAMSGGADLESDADLRGRCALAPYRKALGKPERTWESLALDLVGVARAVCLSNWAGPGTFKVAVWSRDAEGTLVPASAELVALVDAVLQEYVIAGVVLTTAAAAGPVQDVTCYLEMEEGHEFAAAALLAKSAIEACFGGGGDLIHAELVAAVMGVDWVADCLIAVPSANVTVGEGEVLIAGDVRVLPMGWDGDYI